MPKQSRRFSAQAIGAYGEKAAEAELIRHGWVTANINTSMKNAVDFDIFARKGKSAVAVRVKACGPGVNAFAFGGFRPGQGIKFGNLGKADFTVLVGMGKQRSEDVFYVVPTRIVRKRIDTHRTYYLCKRGRGGNQRKDLGWWTLHLADLKSGEDRPSYGLADKWKRYLDNWTALEGGRANKRRK
jgi:hypothetical protein